MDLKAPVIFYKYPSCFFFDTIFILLVDQLKKRYLNLRQSQIIQHVYTYPPVFNLDTIFIIPVDQFKTLYLNPQLSQRPRHVLFPIRFLSQKNAVFEVVRLEVLIVVEVIMMAVLVVVLVALALVVIVWVVIVVVFKTVAVYQQQEKQY